MGIKTIYNEGRVVGLSAYEVYVKHHMSENPEVPPASEREWLSSMIGSGTSLLLKLSTDTVSYSDPEGLEIHEITLPANHKLCAANTIVGSLFFGEGHGGPICSKVLDYGSPIDNPKANDEHVPPKFAFEEKHIDRIKEYAKIIDGGIVLSKHWKNTSDGQPPKDLEPDLYTDAYIRIFLKAPIEQNMFVLLTGFTHKSIISGMVGVSGSTNTPNPQDGDFLGPGVYPWANKIVFSIPPAFTAYYMSGNYTRDIKLDTEHPGYTEVTDNPITDMRAVDPKTYYQTNPADKNNRLFGVETLVDKLHVTGDGAAVLTVFSYDGQNLPPALFGSYVTENGQNDIYPLDVVSPGTVKMFHESDTDAAKRLEDKVPGNFAIIKNDDGELSTFDKDGELQPIAKTYVTNTGNVPTTHVEVGQKHTKSVSLQDPNLNDRPLTDRQLFDVSSPELGNKPLTWKTLLLMLSTDRGLDILGAALRSFRSNLPDVDTTGIGAGVLNLTGTGQSKVGGNFQANSIESRSGHTYKSGRNYITFENGSNDLRLYISATKPTDTDVPIGSIGIGWTD